MSKMAGEIRTSEIPKWMVGTHKVRCVQNPRRFGYYVAGAGVLGAVTKSLGGRQRPGYFASDPDLVGFLDYYVQDDGTLHIGYVLVRQSFQKQGIARALIQAMLDHHPNATCIEWGEIWHEAMGRIKDSLPPDHRRHYGKRFY